MYDHREHRHDRPPETWTPHPGDTERAPAPPPLLGDDSAPAPAPTPTWRPLGAPASTRPPVAPPNASPFVRFIFDLVAGRKSIPLAVAFAVLGPLGLFYISFLHGIAGLIVVPYVVRTLGFGLARAVGASTDTTVVLAVVICWLITVPWAIIAARRRNASLTQ